MSQSLRGELEQLVVELATCEIPADQHPDDALAEDGHGFSVVLRFEVFHLESFVPSAHILMTDRRVLLLVKVLWPWSAPVRVLESIPMSDVSSVSQISTARRTLILGKCIVRVTHAHAKGPIELMLPGEDESAAFAGALKEGAGHLSLTPVLDSQGSLSRRIGEEATLSRPLDPG